MKQESLDAQQAILEEHSEAIKKSPVKSLISNGCSKAKRMKNDTISSDESGNVESVNGENGSIEQKSKEPSEMDGTMRFPCIWYNGGPPTCLPGMDLSPNGNGDSLTVVDHAKDIAKIVDNKVVQARENGHEATDVEEMLQEQTQVAENGQVVKCPECDKVFKRSVYVQRHLEREHWSNARVFRCDDCGYQTKHQSNLSVHRRIHTGERPYHCGACGQRYTQGHLLKAHIKSRHAGNLEFYKLDKKGERSKRGRKSLDMCVSEIKPDMMNFQEREKVPENCPSNSDIEHYANMLPQLDFSGPLLHPQLAMAANLRPNMKAFPLGPIGNGAMLPAGLTRELMLAEQVRMPLPHGAIPPCMISLAGAMPCGPTVPIPMKEEGSPVNLSTPTPPTPTPEEIQNLPQDLTVKKSRREPVCNNLAGPKHLLEQKSYIPHVPHPTAHVGATTKREKNLHKCIEDDHCKHAQKLHELRKNVLRMLSVLSPDLNIENCMDYETDQVDRLLHEVIYSSMEDNQKG